MFKSLSLHYSDLPDTHMTCTWPSPDLDLDLSSITNTLLSQFAMPSSSCDDPGLGVTFKVCATALAAWQEAFKCLNIQISNYQVDVTNSQTQLCIV